MATSNTPPKPEDYGLTSDRMEWLSKHIPELESWEQEDKKPHVERDRWRRAGIVVGGVVGGMTWKRKPPVEISADERDRFSNYQKALRDQEHQQE